MSRNKMDGIKNSQKIKVLREKMLGWFEENARTFPWRETKDPFKILIAELMLVRTKSEQVEQIYCDFMKKYPDVKSLADADLSELKIILESLGLEWRINYFKKLACELISRYNGDVPRTRKELSALSGVGDYIAGAVLSISFGKKEWMVDSNIARLFTRYFGLTIKGEPRRDLVIKEIAKEYVNYNSPGKCNLALLDFSSIVCRPREPDCMGCILLDDCRYYVRLENIVNREEKDG